MLTVLTVVFSLADSFEQDSWKVPSLKKFQKILN